MLNCYESIIKIWNHKLSIDLVLILMSKLAVTEWLPSCRWSGVFVRWAVVEGSEHPGVCSGAGGLSAGEDGGPCGCRWFPLWSAEWAGQHLHVGGEHCRTVRADWEGRSHKRHRLVNTLPPFFFPSFLLFLSHSIPPTACPPYYFLPSLPPSFPSFL